MTISIVFALCHSVLVRRKLPSRGVVSFVNEGEDDISTFGLELSMGTSK
ncbi:hypothetical protein AB6G19_04970 [Providencia manganoxydans]